MEIVGERTGYPREMLDLNLDLEADLGIDSIKRMEILGHYVQRLFPPESDGPPEELGELSGVKTLGEIINRAADYLENLRPKHTVEAPLTGQTLSSASPVQPGEQESLPRFTLTAIPAPEPKPSLRLAPNRVVMITDDGRGIAAALRQKLQQRGLKTVLIRIGGREAEGAAGYNLTAGSPTSATHLVEKIRREQGAIGGLVHLGPLRPCMPYEQLELKGWRERLQEDVGSLYLILNSAAAEFKEAAAAGGAWVVAASGLGGHLDRGLSKSSGFFPGHGAIPGLLKTLALEWPEVRVKSLNLLLEEPAAQLADHLLTEIEAGDELVEVGYREGHRLTSGWRDMPLTARLDNGLKIDSSSVILVTGGARGITAAVTLELARQYRPILLVAGRTPVPAEAEEVETAGLTQPQELKAVLIAQRQRRGQDIKLPEVEAAYQNLLKARELRANLAALGATGAQVRYFQVDVRTPAFGDLLDQIYSHYGRLDGVIHGAGIIEDKLLQDKTWESFDRVFGTKTESAFILSRKLRPETLKFLVLFSSVAGRFGSRGQADYTAANEVYNQLAVYLDQKWPGRVLAINWGPWKSVGMASPEVQRQFEEQGVGLIAPAAGARIFDLELHRGRKGEAEVIIGDGPWRLKALPSIPAEAAPPVLPLLQHFAACRKTGGFLEISRRLDPDYDLYLKDHRLDFKSVLPAAMAIEFMAEAGRMACPGCQMVGLKGVRVLKGIVLAEVSQDILIQVDLPASLTEPAELKVTIKDPVRQELLFYQGTVVLSQSPQLPEKYHLPLAGDFQPFGLSVIQAYNSLTFHGPIFQGIHSIQGISDKGMLATLAPSAPQSCLAGKPAGQWLIDPIVMDCGLQLGLLWWRTYLDVTPLPTSFEEIRLFQPFHTVERLRCYYEVLSLVGQQTMYANIYFFSRDGQLLGLVKGFESTGSKALNRLAGSHLLLKFGDR
jgi:NAD(P)-dependent dehydrogenase (short-subunit alcohol dehydrogenase family)